MPLLETVEELVEYLADCAGIYTQGLRFDGLTVAESRLHTDWRADHAPDCGCRACWCGRMADRIRTAVANEQLIALERSTL